jgi:copper resistance protein B
MMGARVTTSSSNGIRRSGIVPPSKAILNICCGIALNIALISLVQAMEGDDPTLAMVKIDQLEWRDTSGPDVAYFEGEGWIGKDLNKVWFKGEYEHSDGSTEEAELQVLYSRAIAPFWDAQVGMREDFKPEPSRSWLALGFEGLAPYWFELNTAMFIGESGRTAFRLEAEYEILFTQRLILSPELEINAYGKNDEATGTGSGLSDANFGLRLRYEIRREFAPYIGVNWYKKYGNTADLSREEGEAVSDTSLVIGIRAWF